MRHVAAGTPIAVHGDYDVDGVCSASVLASTLEALGARTHVRLPSRDEGYGLSVERVEELHAAGARLLITTDCGITACAEVARARELGMDMVVTDHHRPGDVLPACPVVHPEVCGYPAELCATGVAYKFAQALYQAAERDVAELERELDLVALATVADLVPLVGENRALVKQGLRAIAGTSRPGLRALLRVATVDPQSVTEQTLGFALAPRINAAGRLYRADAALELVLHARRRPRAADCTRARRDQHRAPVRRDRDPLRGRASARRARCERVGRRCRSPLRPRPRGVASRRDRDRRLTVGRPLPPALRDGRDVGVRRRPRLGPQHPPVRPARRPGRERRPPGGVRRPPDGRGPAGARRAPRRLPRRDRGARAWLPHSRGPHQGRARGRRRPRRRARPRSGRGAAGVAPLRHGQPRDQRAGTGREGVRRAPDGRRRPPRALQCHVRWLALACGRLRHRARQQRARQRRHAPRSRGQARGKRMAGSGRAAPRRALTAPGRGARSMRRRPRRRTSPGGTASGLLTNGSSPPHCQLRTAIRELSSTSATGAHSACWATS